MSIDTDQTEWLESSHLCCGQWRRLPELSFYESGKPPQSCVYQVEMVDGTDIRITQVYRKIAT